MTKRTTDQILMPRAVGEFIDAAFVKRLEEFIIARQQSGKETESMKLKEEHNYMLYPVKPSKCWICGEMTAVRGNADSTVKDDGNLSIFSEEFPLCLGCIADDLGRVIDPERECGVIGVEYVFGSRGNKEAVMTMLRLVHNR